MTKHTFEKVRLDIDGGVARLAFNDPAVMNAMGRPMIEDFLKALDIIEAPDSGVRCLVVTGEGRAFCTGANLADGHLDLDAPVHTRDTGAILENGFHTLLRRWRRLVIPVITEVNGPAAGIGMSYALMGDMILAARSAYFLQAFRRIGLVPDGGSTWLLPRLVGLARAKELSLMGEKLPAETALEWGLINRVYDDADLRGEADKLARNLAEGPTVALGLTRLLYAESVDNTYEEQLNLERWTQQKAGRTHDFGEGVFAFLQKRKADFQGK